MTERNEVSDFVEQVLIGISDGVRKAQEHSRETKGVPIAVGKLNSQPVRQEGSQVEFSLNLRVSKNKSVEGKVQADGLLVQLVGVSGTGAGSGSSENLTDHKVTFSVPLYFSSDYVEAK